MRTTGPGQSLPLLLDMIPILDQQRIPYAAIGAVAGSFYGAVRASLDADAIILVEDSRNVMELCHHLKEIGLAIASKN